METDLTSHRIEGYLPDDSKFSIPLYSEIIPRLTLPVIGGLYIGGTPATHAPYQAPDFAHAIIDLFGESYAHRIGTLHRAQPIGDWGGSIPPDAWFERNCIFIDKQRHEGRNVLVHCQAGVNRSSLLCAVYLTRYEGLNGEEAIQLIRDRRSDLCFANPTFEEYVRGLPARELDGA